MNSLSVYLHDEHVGQLYVDHGQVSFQYADLYLAKAGVTPVSVSLPLQPDRFPDSQTRPFFSGLLPDDDLKKRIARYLHISDQNLYAMLEAIGRECAGAIALYPDDEVPNHNAQSIDLLDDERLFKMLQLLRQRPLLVGEDNVRLSLAGAQDKIAVVVERDQIALAQDGRPTTHILKPSIRDLPESVLNEFVCMRLAKAIGIETAEVEIRTCQGDQFLLVKRYDRICHDDNTLQRLHQEDFCQALGCLPEQKYQNEGGPGLMKCLDLLKNHSSQPAVDQQAFLRRIIFNYVIGNADAHAKNFSLLYANDGIRLAPAYDVLATSVYPGLTKKMAMKIAGKYDADYICHRHWLGLMGDGQMARKVMVRMIDEIIASIEEQLPAIVQSVDGQITGDINTLIQKRLYRLML